LEVTFTCIWQVAPGAIWASASESEVEPATAVNAADVPQLAERLGETVPENIILEAPLLLKSSDKKR
jgi:hypothetical protein